MRERRALRFLVEALFLGALAAALVVADLDPLWIAGVMLLGWIVVAFYEWAATRELPHYGRGLPPRYYVPQIALPPPRQLEQLRSGYPAASPDDQATWIATPAMRAEALADWPVNPAGGPLPPASPGEDTIVVDLPFPGEEEFHQDTWIELDPIAEGRGRDEAVPVAVVEEIVEVEPEAVVELPPVILEPEPEPVAALVEEPPPLPEEPEVVEPVVEEADEGVLDDLESAALATAVAAPEAAGVPDASLGNGGDPVLAAAAAVVAEPEALVEEPEPEAVVVEPEPEPEVVAEAEPEAVEGFDPAIAVAAAAVAVEPEGIAEPEPEPDHRLEPLVAAAAASAILADHEPDAEVAVREPESVEAELEPVVAAAAVGAAVADRDALAEPELEDDTEESAVATPVAPAPERPSRHTFDPLADNAPSRRRWRRRDDPWVEVPSRPPPPLALPGAARREP